MSRSAMSCWKPPTKVISPLRKRAHRTGTARSVVSVCFALGVGFCPLLVGCGQVEPSVDMTPAAPDDDAMTVADEVTPEPEPPRPIPPLPDGEADDGGYTISQVMQLAHESKLYRRLFGKTPDPDAMKQLKMLYGDLPKREPPKGELEDWKKRADALGEAVAAMERGEADAEAMLKRAVNCNSCHSRHRSS